MALGMNIALVGGGGLVDHYQALLNDAFLSLFFLLRIVFVTTDRVVDHGETTTVFGLRRCRPDSLSQLLRDGQVGLSVALVIHF